MHYAFNKSCENYDSSIPMTYSMRHGLFVCVKYFGALRKELSAVPLY